ncbi:hypothetical protein CI15_00335 [Paraburkholderia monticola]|uniref:Uncharacterized protein n=1 Tax=Paraburkholderia monticola TaxID=1399968 RepID=A0A149Q172_9BURK|nr:hypothetical protein [Paraburkholderia monticola]KXU91081.1 hypothetical protein CI15_00335 [Paraburkholderia monticola]
MSNITSKVEAACAFLRAHLRLCIAAGDGVYVRAQEAGHSRRTIERACAVLRVVKTRSTRFGTSHWELPRREVRS